LAVLSFPAEVTAAVSLVETPAYLWKATAVAKDFIGIKYSNKTSHSMAMLLESRFASKDPKSIQKGTKAAVAMAFEVAAETEASMQQEQTEHLPPELDLGISWQLEFSGARSKLLGCWPQS
jgi:hypothetical protein